MATLEKTGIVYNSEYVCTEIREKHPMHLFGVEPADGYVVAVRGDDVKWDNNDSKFKQFCTKNGLAVTALERLHPGSVPFFGQQHVVNDKIRALTKPPYMKFAIVLSGAKYLSDFKYVETVTRRLNGESLKALVETAREKADELGAEAERYGTFGDARHINLDEATEKEVRRFAAKQFDMFPNIPADERDQYLLYMIGRYTVFTAAILQKLDPDVVDDGNYVGVMHKNEDCAKGPVYRLAVTNPMLVKADAVAHVKPLFLLPDKNIDSQVLSSLKKSIKKKPEQTRETYRDALMALFNDQDLTIERYEFGPVLSLVYSLCAIACPQFIKLDDSYRETGFAKNRWKLVMDVLKGCVDVEDRQEQIAVMGLAAGLSGHHCLEQLRLITGSDDVIQSRSPYGKHAITLRDMSSEVDKGGLGVVQKVFDALSPARTEYFVPVEPPEPTQQAKPAMGGDARKEFNRVRAVCNDARTLFKFNWMQEQLIKLGMNVPLFVLEVLAPIFESDVPEKLLQAPNDEDRTCAYCRCKEIDRENKKLCPCIVLGGALCRLVGQRVQPAVARACVATHTALDWEGNAERTKAETKDAAFAKESLVMNVLNPKRGGPRGKTRLTNATNENWGVDRFKRTIGSGKDVQVDDVVDWVEENGLQLFDGEYSTVVKSIKNKVNKFNGEMTRQFNANSLVDRVVQRRGAAASAPVTASRYAKQDPITTTGEYIKRMDAVLAGDKAQESDIDEFCYKLCGSSGANDCLDPALESLLRECLVEALLCVERKIVSDVMYTAEVAETTVKNLDSESVLVLAGREHSEMKQTVSYNLNPNCSPNAVVSRELLGTQAYVINHVASNGYQKKSGALSCSRDGIRNILNQQKAGIGMTVDTIDGQLWVPEVTATEDERVFTLTVTRSAILDNVEVTSPVLVTGTAASYKQKYKKDAPANDEAHGVLDVEGDSMGLGGEDFPEKGELGYQPHSLTDASPSLITALSRSNLKFRLLGQDKFMDKTHAVACARDTAAYLYNNAGIGGHKESVNKPGVAPLVAMLRRVLAAVTEAVGVHLKKTLKRCAPKPAKRRESNLANLVCRAQRGKAMRALVESALLKNHRLAGSLNALFVAVEVYGPKCDKVHLGTPWSLVEELGCAITSVMVQATLHLNPPKGLRDNVAIMYGLSDNGGILSRARVLASQAVVRVRGLCSSYADRHDAGTLETHRNTVNVSGGYSASVMRVAAGQSISSKHFSPPSYAVTMMLITMPEPAVNMAQELTFDQLRQSMTPEDLLEWAIEKERGDTVMVKIHADAIGDLPEERAFEACVAFFGFDERQANLYRGVFNLFFTREEEEMSDVEIAPAADAPPPNDPPAGPPAAAPAVASPAKKKRKRHEIPRGEPVKRAKITPRKTVLRAKMVIKDSDTDSDVTNCDEERESEIDEKTSDGDDEYSQMTSQRWGPM